MKTTRKRSKSKNRCIVSEMIAQKADITISKMLDEIPYLKEEPVKEKRENLNFRFNLDEFDNLDGFFRFSVTPIYNHYK